VKLAVCQSHHVAHTVGVCKEQNSLYTRSMKDRAGAGDNIQASRRPVAVDLTVAIQTPRLQIIVVPEFELIRLQYSPSPPTLRFWTYWLCTQ
jgi:hypothetical protein